MWDDIRLLAVLALVAVCCAAPKRAKHLEQPTLETIEPASSEGAVELGESVPTGFLRPCRTVSSLAGLVELSCGEHQIVEFRKADSTGGGDKDLDAAVTVLKARFGELREQRSDARIDDLPVRLTRFKAESVEGMAVAVTNKQAQYWVFACYRTGGSAEDFCTDAIATAARAGGLAHVQAKPLESFGEGRVKVPKDCQATPGSRISCATGQLSWSPKGGRDAKVLRDETLQKIRSMALKEKVALKVAKKDCQLLGTKAECTLLEVSNPKASEALHFVLVIGGGQDRLVVCTYPEATAGALPEPCSQAIEVDLQ